MQKNRRRNFRNKRFSQLYHDKKFIKGLSIVVLSLFVLLLCVIVFCYFYNSNKQKQFLDELDANQEMANANTASDEKTQDENQEETSQKAPLNTTFTLTAIGDVMCHNTQYFDAYIKETDDYDFSYVFEDIKRHIKTSDIAIGSLETSFAGKERGYSNYPTFNSPDNLAYSLKEIGLDVLSTAGNHCLDMGFSGLSRTIDVLNDAGISHLGTYKTR